MGDEVQQDQSDLKGIQKIVRTKKVLKVYDILRYLS